MRKFLLATTLLFACFYLVAIQQPEVPADFSFANALLRRSDSVSEYIKQIGDLHSIKSGPVKITAIPVITESFVLAVYPEMVMKRLTQEQMIEEIRDVVQQIDSKQPMGDHFFMVVQYESESADWQTSSFTIDRNFFTYVFLDNDKGEYLNVEGHSDIEALTVDETYPLHEFYLWFEKSLLDLSEFLEFFKDAKEVYITIGDPVFDGETIRFELPINSMFSQMPEGPRKLIETIRSHLMVSFSGADVQPLMHQTYGCTIETPENPTKEGHIFSGWFKDSSFSIEWDFTNDKIYGDLTLFAKWEPLVNEETINQEIGQEPSEQVVAIAAGGFHSLFLKEDGSLWATGYNEYGQLGIGTSGRILEKFTVGVDENTPVYVANGIKDIDAGLYHTLILKEDGTLWATGRNNEGQLGDGTTSDRSEPVFVIERVKEIVAGAYHSLILKEDGTLWATGYNRYGQLGVGTSGSTFGDFKEGVDAKTPVYVTSDVKAIAAGNHHSLILKQDGTLWGAGRNESGQLGDGTGTNRSVPVHMMSGVVAIAAGESHSLILKDDGFLWATGWNSHGELGDRTRDAKFSPIQITNFVRDISAGAAHSFVLKEDGTLLGTGSNENGEIGVRWNGNIQSLVRVMDEVKEMAGGYSHSIFLKEDGTLWTVGDNSDGQLGDGTLMARSTPIQLSLPKKEQGVDRIEIDFTEGFSNDWIFEGDASWHLDTSNTFKGNQCVRSGEITDGQKSVIKLMVNIPKSGGVSFSYFTSSEAGYDQLIFTVDREEKGRWSGISGWRQESLLLDPGLHTLEWKYEKDESESHWKDTVWLDDIKIVGQLVEEIQRQEINSIHLTYVEGGMFQIGDSSRGDAGDGLEHSVMVDSFYMSTYEITQDIYEKVMRSNPSYWKGAQLPVEQVNWYEAVEFANALSRRDGLEEVYTINKERVICDWNKNGYRLPTEAEWEYAAKGGNSSLGYTYAGSNLIDDVAWFLENSQIRTHQVGTKAPNELGLYDMTGNVGEWCWDWYGSNSTSERKNPTGPSTGSYRVIRGGSWVNLATIGRRFFQAPESRDLKIGLRLVLSADSMNAMISDSNPQDASKQTNMFKVRKVGPAGGRIFYENPNWETDGWRYLEAAPEGWNGDDVDPLEFFGHHRPQGKNITVGTNDYLGSGKKNTEALVQAMGEKGYAASYGSTRTLYAAKICADYTLTVGGKVYDDWFLPSSKELEMMFAQLQRTGLGGFTSGAYWSSSEGIAENALIVDFGKAQWDVRPRYSLQRVRPVRAF